MRFFSSPIQMPTSRFLRNFRLPNELYRSCGRHPSRAQPLLGDDTMAQLDYKFAEYKERVYETYQTQLYCYAWLIEENFQKPVNRGYLVYVRSQHKIVEVPIDETNKADVRKAAESIQEIIQHNFYPKATKYKKRCPNCIYRNICTK